MNRLIVGLACHSKAFAAEARGDLDGAEAAFRQALRGIGARLDDKDLPAQLAARAAAYPAAANPPAAVAAMFKACLPDWLLDVHLGRCAAAIAQSRVPSARMHWGLVLAGEELGRTSYRRAVDDCRSWIETRFLPSLSDAPSARAAQLDLGERLLWVDPDHRQIRMRLLDGYAVGVQGGLEAPAPDGKRRGDREVRSRRRLGARRPNPARMCRYARRLRVHALALSRSEQEKGQREHLVQVFRLLAAYGRQEADEDFVERMQRQARRLARPFAAPDGPPPRPYARPSAAPPPALEKNPFEPDGNPYDVNPLCTLGVSPTDDDGMISVVARQPRSGPQLLDPRVAQRLLEDRVLRLAYDLMREATTTIDPGAEP